MNSNKVRAAVKCSDCGKPRCVYAKLKLTKPQHDAIADMISAAEYTCGAPLFMDDNEFAEIAIVRHGINCTSTMEVPYFNSKADLRLCCFFCGGTHQLLQDTDPYMLGMRRKYSVVRPLCSACRTEGREAATRNQTKTGTAAKRSKK